MKKLLSLITLFTLGAFSALTSWGAALTEEILNDIIANPQNHKNETYDNISASVGDGKSKTIGFIKFETDTAISTDGDGRLVIKTRGNENWNGQGHVTIIGDVTAGAQIVFEGTGNYDSKNLWFDPGVTIKGGTERATTIKAGSFVVATCEYTVKSGGDTSVSYTKGTLLLDGRDGAGIVLTATGLTGLYSVNKAIGTCGTFSLKGAVTFDVTVPSYASLSYDVLVYGEEPESPKPGKDQRIFTSEFRLEDVFQVGEISYANVNDAIAAINGMGPKTGIVKILDNCETAGFTIPADCNVTLDLNGKAMSVTSAITVNGALTVSNGGEIEAANGFAGDALIVNKGTFTSDASVQIKGAQAPFAMTCESGSTGTCAGDSIYGAVEFAGGDFTWNDGGATANFANVTAMSIRSGTEDVGEVLLTPYALGGIVVDFITEDAEGGMKRVTLGVKVPFAVGDDKYETIAEAMSANPDGATIALQRAVESVGFTVPANCAMTLDLNGAVLTMTSPIVIADGGSLTVTGAGLITAAANFEGAALIVNNGSLTASGDIFEGKIELAGGDVNWSNGTATSFSRNVSIVFSAALQDSTDVAALGNLSLPSLCKMASLPQIPVTGYKWDAGDSDSYTIVVQPPVMIGSAYYPSLADAVAAAKTGDTLVLQCSFATDAVTIPSGKTLAIDAYSYTLTLKAPITVEKDAKLTLWGRSVSAGIITSSNFDGDEMFTNHGSLEFGKLGTKLYYCPVKPIPGTKITTCLPETTFKNQYMILDGSIELAGGEATFASPNDDFTTYKTLSLTVNGEIPLDNVNLYRTVTGEAQPKLPDGYQWGSAAVSNYYHLERVEYAAKIGESGFPTLESALAAAESNQVVTLLAEVVDSALELTVPAFVTLDTGHNLLSVAAVYLNVGSIVLAQGTFNTPGKDVQNVQPASGITGWEVDDAVSMSWNAHTYTLKEVYGIRYFDGSAELTGLTPAKYRVETGVTLPTPTKTGYRFEGWYDNAELTGDVLTEIKKGEQGDKVFYAQFAESGFKVGDTVYATLAEAYAAVSEDKTITLTDDLSGSGLVIDRDVTIDFGGHTYTCTEPVEYSNAANQAFRILPGNTVTFSNGTIAVYAADDQFRYVILSAANLTLDRMTVSRSGVSAVTADFYLLACIGGAACVQNGSLLNHGDHPQDTAKRYAIGTLKGEGSEVPTVTVTDQDPKHDKTQIGWVALGGGNLYLEHGKLSPNYIVIVDDWDGTGATVWKGPAFEGYKSGVAVNSPAGYAWDCDGVLRPAVAKIGGTEYASIESAVAAATTDGTTITLLKDVVETVGFAVTNKASVTVDLGGFGYTGAAGMLLMAEKPMTIRNGLLKDCRLAIASAEEGVLAFGDGMAFDNVTLDVSALAGLEHGQRYAIAEAKGTVSGLTVTGLPDTWTVRWKNSRLMLYETPGLAIIVK